MELLRAIRANDYKKVEKKLKKNIDINAEILERINGKSIYTLPLSLVAARGFTQLAILMIQHGADVHSYNVDWSPPLHTATFHGHLGMIALLLDHNADVNSQDMHGDTAINVSIKKHNLQAFKLLMKLRPDLEISNFRNETAISLARLMGERTDEAREINELVQTHIRKEFEHFIKTPEVKKTPRKKSDNEHCKLSETERLRQQLEELECEEINNDIETKKKEIHRLTKDIEDDKTEAKRMQSALKKLESKLKIHKNALVTKETIKKKIEKDIQELEAKKTFRSRGDEIKNDSLECPICFCIPVPPKLVYQCKSGHIYCESCHKKMDLCPQCRVELDKVDPIRNRAFEEIISNIYNNKK